MLSALKSGGPPGGRRLAFALVALPLAAHLFILTRFWFDAPILDDYDCILDSMLSMSRAASVREWLGYVFALQNEHRLAGSRLIPQLLAWATGGLDFRLFMLFGTLCMFGAFAFMWREFRGETSPLVATAAAFLLLQWSYNEALLMASASTAHLGVVFFSIAGLYFALRPGWRAAALCVAGGLLAAYSQANGLFVLPIAGVGAFLLGKRRRAALYVGVAALVWILYFTNYVKPAHHPSLMRAFDDPVKTVQLFLIIIGGIVPMLDIAQVVGAAILAGIAWMAWKGLWRTHPTVFLWIAFILASAAAVDVGRVGFGLHHASRYAVNPAQLLAMLAFGIYALTKPWRTELELAALGAAALLWAGIAVLAAPEIRERSFRGHLLVEVDRSSAPLGLPRFAGVQHPSPEHGARVLAGSEEHGWYVPPRHRIDAPAVGASAARPPAARVAGVMDEVVAQGRDVVLRGWTDYPAILAQRRFTLYPAGPISAARLESLQVREDVAIALRQPDRLLSGFRIVAEYPSEDEARAAAARLCVVVEAPGLPPTRIQRNGVGCE